MTTARLKHRMSDYREIAVNAIDATKRTRKDMGDIAGLADSIRELGLLQPIVINRARELVFGGRRLAAVKSLGWETVPVFEAQNLDDALTRMRAECDENRCRKDFTLSEKHAMARAIRELEEPHATARRRAGNAQGGRQSHQVASKLDATSPVGNGRPERVRTDAIAAEVVGMSKSQLHKLETVIAAAESDPKTFGDIVPQMDISGNVHQAFTEMRRRQKRAELKAKSRKAKRKLKGELWRIINDDCLNALENQVAEGSVRLIFADPPYNIGIDYGRGERADRLPADEYLAWCRNWMELSASRLTSDGSLWVMINDEWAAHFALMLAEIGLTRRSWNKWYETFGNNCANNFNRCSRHIFYCVKDPKRFVFNADAVTRPSDRQAKYGDSRADPGGKIWDDVWKIDRIPGTSAERMPDFPTQVPLAITRAIVGCASDPGDLVVDPFSGSGSTGCAAIEFGRRYLGIEQEERFCELSDQRLLAHAEQTPNDHRIA